MSKVRRRSSWAPPWLGISVLALAIGAHASTGAEHERGPAVPVFVGNKSRPVPSVRLPIVRVAPPVPPTVRRGSGFGLRGGRRTGKPTFHAGADFPAPRGTPVFATQKGVVVWVTRDDHVLPGFGGYGNAVVLEHPRAEAFTLYAHLDETRVHAGMRVAPGRRLGSVGRTSNGRFAGMAPHLHFEVRRKRDDGGPPFPGSYGLYNEDPLAWLADRGIEYASDGLLRRSRDAAPRGHLLTR